MKRRGRQARLGQALDGVVRRLDRKSGGAYSSARVAAVWANIAGPLVAAHTTGAHLRDGTMVVYVDGPIWATELASMAEHYRTSVNSAIGEDLVSTVRFNVSRKVSLEHRLQRLELATDEFYSEAVVASVPLTETELAQIMASVAGIPDEELREAVLRATVRDIEWKKGLRDGSGR